MSYTRITSSMSSMTMPSSETILTSPIYASLQNSLQHIKNYIIPIVSTIFQLIKHIFAPLYNSAIMMGVRSHIVALRTFLTVNYKPRQRHIFAALGVAFAATLVLFTIFSATSVIIAHQNHKKHAEFKTLSKILLGS